MGNHRNNDSVIVTFKLVFFSKSNLIGHHVEFFLPEQAYHSIARCVSALTIACPNEAENVVNKFISDIKVCSDLFQVPPAKQTFNFLK